MNSMQSSCCALAMSPFGRRSFRNNARCSWRFQVLADGIQLQPVLLKKLCRERPLLAQKSKQHVLDSNVPVAQAFRFFCGVSQNSLGFVAQRKVDRSWQLRLSLISHSGFRFDLLANR